MRAVLVNVRDGAVLAEELFPYPHGVITSELPNSGVKLHGPDWALQHPDDYLIALKTNISELIRSSRVEPKDIIALGVDFTTCTVVPMAADGKALCQHDEFRDSPHAYVKLWKNHTAHKEADEITEYTHAIKSNVLDNYGYRASSEWFFPKIWEILRKDPKVYNSAYTFLEAGDFIVYKLTGNMVRSGVFAAAKGFHDNVTMSFPNTEYLRGLDPRLENIVKEKHLTGVVRVGTPAGTLTPEMAKALGLHEGLIVCSAHADAACTLPGAGIVEPNIMTYVMGTSTCHMMMAKEMVNIPGMCATYYDGILPGYYCYEGGQSAVGDIFDWFTKKFLPKAYTDEAAQRKIHIMQLMNEKAAKYSVGQSGLIALDWMNGNRSILQDSNLTGIIMGLTLSTTPEEIYLALLEATAFGTKVIMDQFAAYNIKIDKLYACGGLAQKNTLLMQIYSDVMGQDITVSAVRETSALASAIFAAVAAKKENGGYDDYSEAVNAMVPKPFKTYYPNRENVEKYEELYSIYKGLHDYMSQSENNPMKKLRSLQHEAFNE